MRTPKFVPGTLKIRKICQRLYHVTISFPKKDFVLLEVFGDVFTTLKIHILFLLKCLLRVLHQIKMEGQELYLHSHQKKLKK